MAASLQLEEIALDKLFLNRMPRLTKKAFLFCLKLPFLVHNNWYLAGGTALALQTGHRKSIDLDFFSSERSFDELAVERELINNNSWLTTYREKGTLYGTLLGAKMSFIAYPFFVPSRRRFCCGYVKILLPEDIAIMKIIAISQRGRKRDFVDLYWYCSNRQPLATVIRRTIKQYPGQQNNLNHILKSLTYFADAEADPMPELYFKTNWQQIKRFFRQEIKTITRKFLSL